MHKPYALSLWGHVCYFTYLQEWLQSQWENNDDDGGPHCRAEIRSRPVQVFLAKVAVEALSIELEGEPAAALGTSPTGASASAFSDHPGHGIFADVDEGDVEDEEVEDHCVEQDGDELGVCETCRADFDLDGYCMGCGQPADFAYSDEQDEDDDDAWSPWRS